MAADGTEHLWLDATGLEEFAVRFPTIAASLASVGLDPATDWLPIAPAAHHLSGGVLTDLVGATALPGLWAAGETACTGVHGANRLASNSLLEGMVFGARVAEAILAGVEGPSATGAMRAVLVGGETPIRGCRAVAPPPLPEPGGMDAGAGGMAELRGRLQSAMTAGAGVVRSAASLAAARASLGDLADAWSRAPERETAAGHEIRNLCTVAGALLASATQREESRGAHTRSDFPSPEPAWRCRLVHAHGPRRD